MRLLAFLILLAFAPFGHADEPHVPKKDRPEARDAMAGQVLQCLAGLKRAGGLPQGIEIDESNSGAVSLCDLVVTKDGFYRFELPKLSSDGDSIGRSQLGWLVHTGDYKITLPNSRKKVRVAKVGQLQQAIAGAIAVTPFCGNKEEDLPELPLKKVGADDPYVQAMSGCVRNFLTNGTSQRIRALVNALNERGAGAPAKPPLRAELERIGWPDKLKERIETWVAPCKTLLNEQDRNGFFGNAEVQGGFIGFTKTLKINR